MSLANQGFSNKSYRRYTARDVNGIILLNKPKGISSNQALQKVKHLFQAKKAGHTGSLDPLATGMLPICFGEATKFSNFLLDADKAYQTIGKLGIATDTGDAEGKIIQTEKVSALSEERILQMLRQFIGVIEQIPPMHSALKYQGQPLYKLARQGKEVERKTRLVTIYDIKLLGTESDTIFFEVHCSKGTYIRTLVEDIAKVLKTVGHVQLLHRLWVAPFNEQPQYELDFLNNIGSIDEKDKLLLPVDFALKRLPIITLNHCDAKKLQSGQAIQLSQPFLGEVVRLYTEDKVFLGVGEMRDHKIYSKRLVNVRI